MLCNLPLPDQPGDIQSPIDQNQVSQKCCNRPVVMSHTKYCPNHFFQRTRSSKGSMAIYGVALTGMILVISLSIVAFITNVSLCTYNEMKLGFTTDQVANYATALGTNYSQDKAKAFAHDLFIKMGLPPSDLSIKVVPKLLNGKTAMSATLTRGDLSYRSTSNPIMTAYNGNGAGYPGYAGYDSSGFQKFATYKDLGQLLNKVVGPGPNAGTQNIYLSYIYAFSALELVAVDPYSGQTRVFSSPVASETGAWGMTVGTDGNVYLGTLPNAHLLQLNTKTGMLTDLGRPCSSESYIWGLTTAPDGNIYGCTYPSCKLFCFHPKTQAMEDLGRMDPQQQYGRSIACGNDGFVYVGIGTKANISAYEIATGRHTEILAAQYQSTSFAWVNQGIDGTAYGSIDGQYFKLNKGIATPITANQVSTPDYHMTLADGSNVIVEDGTKNIVVGNSKIQMNYDGHALPIFRLGAGPADQIYATPCMPENFLRLDLPGGASWTKLGNIGTGEAYSLLPYQRSLLIGSYSSAAPLMSYDPNKALDLQAGNPAAFGAGKIDTSWRPQAMIEGSDSNVYVGGVPAYGKLGGPLAIWNPTSNSLDVLPNLVTDQSIASLTSWKNQIIGGTDIHGGGGSTPTQSEAKLFVFDTRSKHKTHELVPIKGASGITDLITAYNGMVYGIAYFDDNTAALFVFNPANGRILTSKGQRLPFAIDHSLLYNAVGLGPDGRIWGLSPDGIFVIDTYSDWTSPHAYIVTKAPQTITGGFALKNGFIYLIADYLNPYRYHIPRLN